MLPEIIAVQVDYLFMELDEYRKLAELEDRMWYFSILHDLIDHWLSRHLPSDAAEVLDAGCGTGGLIKTLNRSHPCWRFTGLDLMPMACGLARESTQAEIVQGSVLALPYGDQSFDAVISADVICQVDDAASAVQEFARVLRPGGMVIINVPALMWMWSYHDNSCETKHRYNRPELCDLFAAAGFDLKFSSYRNFLNFPLIAARRKLFPVKNATSDIQAYHPVIEAVPATLGRIELMWQKRNFASPIGTSVFLVATLPHGEQIA